MPTRAVTVTTTAGLLVSENPRRRALAVFNNGTDFILLSQDQVSVAAQGVPLPAGATLSLKRLQGDEPELGWYAIANSGSQNVRIFEGFGNPERVTGTEPGGFP